MTVLYLLDANVFSDANRDYYPIERVPEFWEWLAEMGRLGRVKVPPTINTRLAELCEVVAVADFVPPRQAYDVFEVLSRRAGGELASLRATIDTGVAELDRLIREHGVPMIATGASEEPGWRQWRRSPVYGASVLSPSHEPDRTIRMAPAHFWVISHPSSRSASISLESVVRFVSTTSHTSRSSTSAYR